MTNCFSMMNGPMMWAMGLLTLLIALVLLLGVAALVKYLFVRAK